MQLWKAPKPGLTLVELLVVMLISVMVAAAAVTVYKICLTYYLKTDSLMARNQDLRTALYTITRDVRMAGNGLTLMGPQVTKVQAYVPGRQIETTPHRPTRDDTPGWFRHADISDGASADQWGARAVFGTDGGADYPDTLTVFRAEVEYGVPLGQARQANIGSGTLTIDLVRDFAEGALRVGDIVALADDNNQVTLLEIDGGGLPPGTLLAPASRFSVKLGGRYTPPDAADLSFAAGASVYNLQNAALVTYYVDEENHRLMADYHSVAVLDPDLNVPAPVAIAEDIEDFQVYYYYAATPVALDDTGLDPTISSAFLQANRVTAVAIGLTARSGRGTDADGSTMRRPALFNRQEGAQIDKRPRNTMIELVFLRN